jgi:hypothetical protein
VSLRVRMGGDDGGVRPAVIGVLPVMSNSKLLISSTNIYSNNLRL